jgi:preprotein translocase subunit SecY
LLVFHAGPFRSIPSFIGGTGLLIVVGVALDTIQQMQSHLLLRHYEGFMKKGKLRGRGTRAF